MKPHSVLLWVLFSCIIFCLLFDSVSDLIRKICLVHLARHTFFCQYLQNIGYKTDIRTTMIIYLYKMSHKEKNESIKPSFGLVNHWTLWQIFNRFGDFWRSTLLFLEGWKFLGEGMSESIKATRSIRKFVSLEM